MNELMVPMEFAKTTCQYKASLLGENLTKKEGKFSSFKFGQKTANTEIQLNNCCLGQSRVYLTNELLTPVEFVKATFQLKGSVFGKKLVKKGNLI